MFPLYGHDWVVVSSLRRLHGKGWAYGRMRNDDGQIVDDKSMLELHRTDRASFLAAFLKLSQSTKITAEKDGDLYRLRNCSVLFEKVDEPLALVFVEKDETFRYTFTPAVINSSIFQFPRYGIRIYATRPVRYRSLPTIAIASHRTGLLVDGDVRDFFAKHAVKIQCAFRRHSRRRAVSDG